MTTIFRQHGEIPPTNKLFCTTLRCVVDDYASTILKTFQHTHSKWKVDLVCVESNMYTFNCDRATVLTTTLIHRVRLIQIHG